MAKASSQVTVLERLRGRTWVEHCMQVAGCNQAGLAKKVSAVPDKDLWSKYKNGNAKPPDPTVTAVDLSLPGTAAIWRNGPLGLPLWDVLEQDVVACTRLVREALGKATGAKAWMLSAYVPVAEMDNVELVQALLEQTIPNAWLRPHAEPDASDLKLAEHFQSGNVQAWSDAVEEYERRASELSAASPRRELVRSDNFYSLAEIASLEPNVLAQQYAFFSKFILGAKGVRDVEHGPRRDWNIRDEMRKYPVLLPERSVALLAAAVVCNASSELILKDVALFLTNGLREALTHHFGTAVSQYVEENL